MKRLYIALYKEIGWLRDTIWSSEKSSEMGPDDSVIKEVGADYLPLGFIYIRLTYREPISETPKGLSSAIIGC